MKPFTERYGLVPTKAIQVGSMDEQLRNRLWNALSFCYWDKIRDYERRNNGWYPDDKDLWAFIRLLWHDHLKRSVDTLTRGWHEDHKQLSQHFFQCEWHRVYDFVEFVANTRVEMVSYANQQFIRMCNSILEEEVSGYRFVGTTIAPITSEQEIAEVEQALVSPDPIGTTSGRCRACVCSQLWHDRLDFS